MVDRSNGSATAPTSLTSVLADHRHALAGLLAAWAAEQDVLLARAQWQGLNGGFKALRPLPLNFPPRSKAEADQEHVGLPVSPEQGQRSLKGLLPPQAAVGDPPDDLPADLLEPILEPPSPLRIKLERGSSFANSTCSASHYTSHSTGAASHLSTPQVSDTDADSPRRRGLPKKSAMMWTPQDADLNLDDQDAPQRNHTGTMWSTSEDHDDNDSEDEDEDPDNDDDEDENGLTAPKQANASPIAENWVISYTAFMKSAQRLQESGAIPKGGTLTRGMSRDRLVTPDAHKQRRGWSVLKYFTYVERSPYFEVICSVVIVANTFAMALCENRRATTLSVTCGQDLEALELAFFTFYVVELVVRILARRADFLFGHDWQWNIFDLALVFSTSQEKLLLIFRYGAGDEGFGRGGFAYLRLMRLAKLLRIVRLVRTFHELRMLLNPIMGSIRSIFWSVIFMAAVMLMFSIMFVQGITDHLVDYSGQLDEATAESINKYWGSVTSAIGCLWMAVTGGLDWESAADALLQAGAGYFYLFNLYVGLFLFVIANTLTSLFVDSGRRYSEQDHNQVVHQQMAKQSEYELRLVALYKQMDKEGYGDLSYEQFAGGLQDSEMLAFASSLEIDATDLEQFFKILSGGGRRQVDLETFVIGCGKLRGPARSMDVVELLLAHRESVAEQHRLWQVSGEVFRDMQQEQQSIGAAFSELRYLLLGDCVRSQVAVHHDDEAHTPIDLRLVDEDSEGPFTFI